MKKYAMEFVGTLLFVFCIFGIVASQSTIVPLSIGLTLATLVYTGATISGSHYNPAVTLGLRFRKKINTHTAIGYIISQIIGAIIAFYLARAIFGAGIQPVKISTDVMAVFLSELIFTFALITTVLHVAATKSSQGNSYFGLAIGLIVMAGATAVGSISGGFFNPAVLVGLSLAGGVSGSFVTILLAQIIAAFLAAGFHRLTVGYEK